MDLEPNEWSECKHSGVLKPPRSHYDSVTKKLVLNMDHYCPWMANVVGYGNYRYFFLFLLWMYIGATYASIVATGPFLEMQELRQSAKIHVDRHHRVVYNAEYYEDISNSYATSGVHGIGREHQVHGHVRPTGSLREYYRTHPEAGRGRGRPDKALGSAAAGSTKEQLLADFDNYGLHLDADTEDGGGQTRPVARLRGAVSRAATGRKTSKKTLISMAEEYESRIVTQAEEYMNHAGASASSATQRHLLHVPTLGDIRHQEKQDAQSKQAEVEERAQKLKGVRPRRRMGFTQFQKDGSSHVLSCFMLTSSVAMAVFTLLAMHIHLLLSGQTTIENIGNIKKVKNMKKIGVAWTNPYDQGWQKNWQLVFGKGHPLMAILPSSRLPPWPPYPQHVSAVRMLGV